MTFDEIFQQYVAQGFTKPTAGVSGIETLMPTTATVAPITPIQQPQQTGGGRDDDFTNVPDTTTNLGITSFSDAIQQMQDLYSQIPTPMNLAIKAIQNFQNPYTGIMGNLNQETLDAIARDQARDMQESNRANKTGGYQAGYDSGFMEGPGGGSTGGSPGSSGPGGSDSMGSF
jgi:hypothetical protein